ncbi:MAG: helix-turn-helix transcriptional regulator, partial [Candidatus Tumulicola sp.]
MDIASQVAGEVFETAHVGGTSLAHHHHAAPYVAIVLNGAYVEVNDTVPEFRGQGTVVVHGAGENHADRFASDTRCLNVELPNDVLNPADWDGTTAQAAMLAAAKSVVIAFYRDPATLSEAVRKLCAALRHRVTDAAERPLWLKRVIDEFPWTEAVPLREAAALAGLHETHFSRAFRQHTGM